LNLHVFVNLVLGIHGGLKEKICGLVQVNVDVVTVIQKCGLDQVLSAFGIHGGVHRRACSLESFLGKCGPNFQ
jgi:hypothetical protein